MDYRQLQLFHAIDITREYNECVSFWGLDALPALSMIHSFRYEGIQSTVYATATYPGFSKSVPMCMGTAGSNEFGVFVNLPIHRAIKAVYGADKAKVELRNSIVHELAHIAVYWTTRMEAQLASKGKYINYRHTVASHGSEWGNLMIEAGLPYRASGTPDLYPALLAFKKSPDKFRKA